MLEQASIPVGCVPLALRRTGGLPLRDPETETPVERDPPGQRSPLERTWEQAARQEVFRHFFRNEIPAVNH